MNKATTLDDAEKMTPPRKSPRGLDPELQAMARIDRLLADLDPKQRGRVISWLWDRNSAYVNPTARLPMLDDGK